MSVGVMRQGAKENIVEGMETRTDLDDPDYLEYPGDMDDLEYPEDLSDLEYPDDLDDLKEETNNISLGLEVVEDGTTVRSSSYL